MSPSADARAEARGELHRRPEEVAVVGGDGLTCADADADVEGRGRRRVARLERPLDVDRELHGGDDRGERRHDAVTGVLDLVAPVGRERVADDLVVLLQQRHVAVVAEQLGLGDRAAHVGEDDRAQPRGRVGRRLVGGGAASP